MPELVKRPDICPVVIDKPGLVYVSMRQLKEGETVTRTEEIVSDSVFGDYVGDELVGMEFLDCSEIEMDWR